MNTEENCYKSNINYIRETIFTNNEEREKEKEKEEEKFPKNFTFNLECQKIINGKNGQSKITSELNKLLKFIKESYYYKDINGNRIRPKGELLPTPFQKLEKLNEDIKNYYEHKINRKKSPLFVKNYRNKNKNKNIYLNNNVNNNNNSFNTLTIENKRKTRNFFGSKKFTKDFERLSLYNYINNNKTIKNKSKPKNINLLVNNNNNKHNDKIKKNYSENKDIKVCLSETFNRRRKEFFTGFQFNQINYWKTKMVYPQYLNTNYYIDNMNEKTSRYKDYISEYKKRNKQNNLIYNIPKINKKEDNKNFNNYQKTSKSSNLYRQKTKDFSKDLNKYKLIQFNMNQLIQPDKHHLDKIVLNMRRTQNINKKTLENKTINVDMDNGQ